MGGRLTRSAPALTAAALAVMAGCGGSGRLTRSQLIERADAICRRVDEKRDRTGVTGAGDYARAWPPLAAFERSAFDELDKLVPPPAMAAEWRQLIALDRQGAADRAKAAEDSRTGQFARAEALSQLMTHDEEQSASIGTSDGFAYCSLVET